MNQDFISGKWKEIKGEVRRMWGKITDDELESAKGNTEAISGLIQQKYGLTKEEAKDKLNNVYDKFTSSVSDKAEDIKDGLRH